MALSSTPKESHTKILPDPSSHDSVRINLSDVFNEHMEGETVVASSNGISPLTLHSNEGSVYRTAVEPKSQQHLSLSTRLSQMAKSSIQEMEKLRAQMQEMVESRPEDEGYSPSTGNLSGTSSVDTIALLKSALPATSPGLELDENGILLSSQNLQTFQQGQPVYQQNFSSLQQHFPNFQQNTSMLQQNVPMFHEIHLPLQQQQQQQQEPSSSLYVENTILKENIEKERLRRKHCEEQIYELQNKLLESQEHLAVAVSTEKKKQIMLEQLDKNLAGIVEGWKRQDKSKSELIVQLEKERNMLKSSQVKHDDILKQFEIDLAEAVDAFAKEQDKLKMMKDENIVLIQSLENEKQLLGKEIESMHQTNTKLIEDVKRLKEDREKMDKEKNEILERFQQGSQEWMQSKERFEGELKYLQEEYKRAIDELQEKEEKLSQLEQDKKNLVSENRRILREKEELANEKETLSIELSLSQSKFDTLKTKQDSVIRAKLEAEFNRQIYDIQNQITSTEKQLRESQRTQIRELSKSHHEELQKQQKIFEKELQLKEENLLQLHNEYRQKLQSLHKENGELQDRCSSLETQRGELMNRLKFIMQQQWQDTINLFTQGNTNQKSSVFANASNNQLSSTLRSDIDLTRATRDTHHSNAHTGAPVFHTSNSVQKTASASEPFPKNYQSHNTANSVDQTTNFQQFQNSPGGEFHPISARANHSHDHTDPRNDAVSRFEYNANKLNQGTDLSHTLINMEAIQKQQHIAEKPYQIASSQEDTVKTYHAQNSIMSKHLTTNQTGAVMPVSQRSVEKPFQKIPSVNNEDPFTLLYRDIETVRDNVTDSFQEQNQTSREFSKLNERDASLKFVEGVPQVRHTQQQTEKEAQLTHFIERLLQRSPGEPVGGEAPPQPLKKNQSDREQDSVQASHHSVADDVERVLSEGTPKLKSKEHMAFKKSVVKEPRKHSPVKKNISLDSLRQISGYQAQGKSDEELKLLIRLIQAHSITSSEEPIQQKDERPNNTNNVFERLHRTTSGRHMGEKQALNQGKKTSKASRLNTTKEVIKKSHKVSNTQSSKTQSNYWK